MQEGSEERARKPRSEPASCVFAFRRENNEGALLAPNTLLFPIVSGERRGKRRGKGENGEREEMR